MFATFLLGTRDARRGTRGESLTTAVVSSRANNGTTTQDFFRVSRLASRVSTLPRHILLALLASLTFQQATAAVAVPPLRSPVTDLTHTLTRDQAASLEQTLRAFETRKGSQIAVLIVPTVAPETIEQYSTRVEQTWKLGRKDVSDSVILVIAKNDRKLHIEVGYGLEGALPDAIASRIIRESITPQFKSGEFYLGIVAGVDRILSAVSGEPLPEPTLVERARHPGSGLGGIIVVLLIAAIVVSKVLRSIFGRLGGASIAATGAGFIVWLLVGTIAVAVIAGIVTFLITLLTGGFGGGGFGGGGWTSGRRSGWGGGWGGGLGGLGGLGSGSWAGGGGGWSGGSSGGGGWSGGGGSSGGGGASGSW